MANFKNFIKSRLSLRVIVFCLNTSSLEDGTYFVRRGLIWLNGNESDNVTSFITPSLNSLKLSISLKSRYRLVCESINACTIVPDEYTMCGFSSMLYRPLSDSSTSSNASWSHSSPLRNIFPYDIESCRFNVGVVFNVLRRVSRLRAAHSSP
jgi:hypothetical protein